MDDDIIIGVDDPIDVNTVIIGDYRYALIIDWDNNSTGSARVVDTNQAEYDDMLSSVTYEGRTYPIDGLVECFSGCKNMTSAPALSSNAISLYGCFENCTSLTTAPTIPSGVIDMRACFDGCSSLSSAPSIPSGVTDIRYCFRNCTSLVTAPTIPNSVVNMTNCFYGCVSLSAAPTLPSSLVYMAYAFCRCISITSPPTIPSGVTNMQDTFASCTSLATAPTIPSSVKDMRWCFSGCTSLVTPPSIPSGVETINYTFTGCTALTSMPSIPSSVANMAGCFDGCTALSGNITVSNNPSQTLVMFRDTVGEIYIIPSSLSTYGVNNWRSIAQEYGNVHYFADDAILSITTLSATRTDNNSSTESETGTYAHLVAVYQSGGKIPDGYTQTVTWTLMTTVGSSSTSSTDSWSTVGSGTSEKWVSQALAVTATYQLTLSDNLGNSATLSVTLSKAEALLDFHAGGDGLAIGTFSTGPGFEIAMATNFDEAVKSYNRPWYPCYVYSAFPTDANSAKDESQLPVTPCFVLDTSDNAFYFCDGT